MNKDRQTGVDPSDVLAAIGFSGQTSVEPVLGGADAAIWRVVRGEEHYALRLLRSDQPNQAQRETASMTAATAASVPVPHVIATGTWQDRPVLLLTWSPGDSLRQVLSERPLALRRSHALGVEFGRAQAAIHAIVPSAELCAGGKRWEDWAGPDEDLQACLAGLQQRPTRLLHLDYHPLNVLVANGKVTAILDWANARPGDPRADLARTLSILRLISLPDGLTGAIARIQRRTFEAGWWHGYQEAAGPVDDLAPFCWWAGLVMVRDLAPRVGRPDLPWLTHEFLARVRSWTATWSAKANAESRVVETQHEP
jgi:aminoglycoside phosphotransferase (APT) family kinase protein